MLPGIIPADAGSTPSCSTPSTRAGDHPRGCGEHRLHQPDMPLTRGSSPRMRGALSKRRLSLVGEGIIPADAGSTCCGYRFQNCSKDHPRGCGEHLLAGSPCFLLTGSSPRMRGARRLGRRHERDTRIIPADAGSTGMCWWTSPMTRDHPRGCGEHCAVRPAGRPRCGSSPRMRGARQERPVPV